MQYINYIVCLEKIGIIGKSWLNIGVNLLKSPTNCNFVNYYIRISVVASVEDDVFYVATLSD